MSILEVEERVTHHMKQWGHQLSMYAMKWDMCHSIYYSCYDLIAMAFMISLCYYITAMMQSNGHIF